MRRAPSGAAGEVTVCDGAAPRRTLTSQTTPRHPDPPSVLVLPPLPSFAIHHLLSLHPHAPSLSFTCYFRSPSFSPSPSPSPLPWSFSILLSVSFPSPGHSSPRQPPHATFAQFPFSQSLGSPENIW
ncbi:hypothetical protein MSAN_01802100 [Mycena sanguinolenta]|uniref:Uncharacterized protein n=1 Tax=Mycena sanguinolenta TaxID=230812 RepID=A0A8H7CSM9_9AGAR|nr:hypothetical protein MSAN_01802100 [Mycena sanguinolenta]